MKKKKTWIVLRAKMAALFFQKETQQERVKMTSKIHQGKGFSIDMSF